jgi:hypothetical protein
MRLTLCFAAAATFVFAADRPALNGVWQGSSNSETVTIHQKDDAVEIVEAGRQTSDLQCKTDGKACKIKGGEVMFWYNGPMLVLMETHGTRVVKKRFRPSDDGKNLEIEIIHIEPTGSTEKLTLARRSS